MATRRRKNGSDVGVAATAPGSPAIADDPALRQGFPPGLPLACGRQTHHFPHQIAGEICFHTPLEAMAIALEGGLRALDDVAILTHDLRLLVPPGHAGSVAAAPQPIPATAGGSRRHDVDDDDVLLTE